jgi:hypothetical protein
MKPRIIRRYVGMAVCVATVALVVGTGASVAYGSLTDVPVPLAASVSNPVDPLSPELWWRYGWGNSLRPDFTLNVPVMHTTATPEHPMPDRADEFVVGTLYMIDRDPSSVIDVTRPVDYGRTARGSGTNFTHVLDLLGTLAYPRAPLTSWPTQPNTSDPIEGIWYYHYVFFRDVIDPPRHPRRCGCDATERGGESGREPWLRCSKRSDDLVRKQSSTHLMEAWDI